LEGTVSSIIFGAAVKINPEPSPMSALPTIIILIFSIKDITEPIITKKWKNSTTLRLPPLITGPPRRQPKVTPAMTKTLRRDCFESFSA
jgi:hypothetical protein